MIKKILCGILIALTLISIGVNFSREHNKIILCPQEISHQGNKIEVKEC